MYILVVLPTTLMRPEIFTVWTAVATTTVLVLLEDTRMTQLETRVNIQGLTSLFC